MMWASAGSAIVEGNRFLIKNIVTGNLVESHRTAEEAISACQFLNSHAVDFCKKAARCVVIDRDIAFSFYTDLEYPNLYSYT